MDGWSRPGRGDEEVDEEEAQQLINNPGDRLIAVSHGHLRPAAAETASQLPMTEAQAPPPGSILTPPLLSTYLLVRICIIESIRQLLRHAGQ